MVTFSRKAAERNPAGTAALRRVAIGLTQRRALRHSAGAMRSAASVKRIREEIMNGTFAQRAPRPIWAATHVGNVAHH